MNNKVNSVNQFNQSTKYWYVIYTKPRSEDLTREELERRDIPVFFPRIREAQFRGYRMQETIQPLFPNYIFARFGYPSDYYYVKWAKGVKRVVGNGDTAIPLDDSIVTFLKKQVDEKGLVQPQRSFRNGDRVQVIKGPLKGLLGIVDGSLDAKGRVRVLMNLLSAGAKVILPCWYLDST